MASQQEILDTLKAGLPIKVGNFSNGFLSACASSFIFKSDSGYLHSVFFGSNSSPSLTIYDNSSGASGTVVAIMGANVPIGCYIVDFQVLNGISAYAAAGNFPNIRFDWSK